MQDDIKWDGYLYNNSEQGYCMILLNVLHLLDSSSRLSYNAAIPLNLDKSMETGYISDSQRKHWHEQGYLLLMGFHTDAGPSLQRIHPHADSLPLQFKIKFFLTDLSEPDTANFMCVPGSHKKTYPENRLEKGVYPEGAIQVLAEAGDAVIFPWALWHGVGPNRTDRIRKSVTFRYGLMWCRPYDYDRLPSHVLDRMTPRQRRLFGDMGETFHPTDYYKPNDQLEIICGDEWILSF